MTLAAISAYDVGTISVPSQGLSGQQGIPGKTGLQGPKVLNPSPGGDEWERVGPGRVLETEGYGERGSGEVSSSTGGFISP